MAMIGLSSTTRIERPASGSATATPFKYRWRSNALRSSKFLDAHPIGRPIVEPPGGAFARDAVTNDVFHVRPHRAEVAGDGARVPGLDDDPSRARCHQACSGTQARGHAAFRGGRGDVAALPQRSGAVLAGLPKNKCGVTLRTGSSSIADAPELRIEVVLSHRTSSISHAGEARYGERGGIQEAVKQRSDLEREFRQVTVWPSRRRHRAARTSKVWSSTDAIPLS